MRPFLIIFGFTLLNGQNFIYEEGDWWVLTKPGPIHAITETRDLIYVAAENGLYSYDRWNDILEFDSYLTSRLGASTIYHFYYDWNTDHFWAVHENGISVKSSLGSFWQHVSYPAAWWEIQDVGSSRSYVWLLVNGELVALDPIFGSEADLTDYDFREEITWGASSRGMAGEAADFSTFIIDTDPFSEDEYYTQQRTYYSHPTVKFVDRENNIYFGSDNGDLYIGERGSKRLRPLSIGLAQPQVSEIYKDEVTNWWFADSHFKRTGIQLTSDNLFLTRWDEPQNTWTYYYANEDPAIKDTQVNCMVRYMDYLYLGTMEGLLQLDINRRDWKFISKDLHNTAVWELAVLGNSLYVGTAVGLFEIAADYGIVLPDEKKLLEGFRNFQIYDLLSADSVLYVGAENGCFMMNQDTQQWQRLTPLQINEIAVHNDIIFGSDGYLWQLQPGKQASLIYSDPIVGFSSSFPWIWVNEVNQTVLLKYNTAIQQVFTKHDGIPGNTIYEIGCDPDWVWFGTDNGVAFFNWSRYYENEN